MRIRRSRRWDAVGEDDPGAGLINLFDVWVAFSMALLLALVSYLHQARVFVPNAESAASTGQVLEQLRSSQKILRFRPTDADANGQGTRLGVAYQLSNGEVVYVPDVSPKETPAGGAAMPLVTSTHGGGGSTD